MIIMPCLTKWQKRHCQQVNYLQVKPGFITYQPRRQLNFKVTGTLLLEQVTFKSGVRPKGSELLYPHNNDTNYWFNQFLAMPVPLTFNLTHTPEMFEV